MTRCVFSFTITRIYRKPEVLVGTYSLAAKDPRKQGPVDTANLKIWGVHLRDPGYLTFPFHEDSQRDCHFIVHK